MLGLLAGCGDGDGAGDGGGTTAAPGGGNGCTVQAGGGQASFTRLDASSRHEARFRTSEGAFTVRLDVAHAPCTTSSFAALARQGFFDGTTFHRIVPGFVIQGGDPTGTGSGGPGYTVVEAPPPGTAYVRGVVAMAKGLSEPPGASGSQFFVVTGAGVQLPPDYALLGRVVSGMRTVDRIGRLGNPATEQPTRRVTIRGIAVT